MALTTQVNKTPKKENTAKEKAGDKFLGELEDEARSPVETRGKKNKVPYSTYYRPDLLEEIKKAAEEADVSVNTWINNACKHYLEFGRKG